MYLSEDPLHSIFNLRAKDLPLSRRQGLSGRSLSLLDQLHKLLRSKLALFSRSENSFADFLRADLRFGVNISGGEVAVREWLPDAKSVLFCGDFNRWAADLPLRRNQFGVWEAEFELAHLKISPGDHYKLLVENSRGEKVFRCGAYAKEVDFDPKINEFCPVIPHPTSFTFSHPRPSFPSKLKAFIADQWGRTEFSFCEFREKSLKKIADCGYTCLILSNFGDLMGQNLSASFSFSSSFGDLPSLQRLIDFAHELELLVLIELDYRGLEPLLGDLDGNPLQFFSQARAEQRKICLEKFEVSRLLLSVARHWLDSLNLDGLKIAAAGALIAGPNHPEDPPDLHAAVHLALLSLVAGQAPLKRIVAVDPFQFPGIDRPLLDGGLGLVPLEPQGIS